MPVHRVLHPVADDALLTLRNRTTESGAFRRLAHRISLVLAVEATRDLPTLPASVDSPLEPAEGRTIAGRVAIVPVLRAGLAMVDAVLELLPAAKVGHIGLARDEATAVASRYYSKLPDDLSQTTVFLVDPTLATGCSAVAAIDLLRAAGARDIRLLAILAAPAGVAAVSNAHPDVDLFVAAVDRDLSPAKYILPGYGDFGDRLYGTE